MGSQQQDEGREKVNAGVVTRDSSEQLVQVREEASVPRGLCFNLQIENMFSLCICKS